MTIVASNSLTISNVNDGTITHTAWAYSADGTDRFSTVYPNLNLLVNSSAKTKDGFFKNFDKVENGYGEVTMKATNTWVARDMQKGFSIQPRDYKPGDKYTMSMDVMFTSWNLPAGTTLTEFWLAQRYTAGGGINSWKRICAIDLPKDPSKMLNQWIRITQTSTIPPYEDPAVGAATTLTAIFRGTSEGSFTIRVRYPKQEEGLIVTPHMPSASEVTTADYPSYIGQYSDFTQADSTNPSDYTWSLMRGNDGKDGADGKDGRAGKDGDPGKVVSNTEPSTRFKGLTWKYIGITAIDASDGTNIQPNTEYYWNGKNWVINIIKAQNIDVDNLSAITAVLGDMYGGSLTISKSDTQGMAVKDDAVKSWDIFKVTDYNYPDGYSYTSMGVALDSGGLTFYSADYGHALKKGEVIDSKYEVASLQAIASNGRSSIGKGLVLNATNPNFPFTINGDIDVFGRIRQTSLTKTLSVGNGLSIKFTKNGLGIVQAEFQGEITTVNAGGEMWAPTSYTWVHQEFCPPETISLVGHFTGDNDSFHIDIETTGRVVWWGVEVLRGSKVPRGTVLYFAK